MNIVVATHNDLFNSPRGGEFSILTTLDYLKSFGYNIEIWSRPSPKSNEKIGYINKNGYDVYYVERQTSEGLNEFIKNKDIDILIGWGNTIEMIYDVGIKNDIPYSFWSKSLFYLMPLDKVREWDMDKMDVPGDIIEKYKPIFDNAHSIWGNCKYVSDLIKKWYGRDIGVNYVPVFDKQIKKTEKGEYILFPLMEKLNWLKVKDIAAKFPKEKFLIPTRHSHEVGNIDNLYVFDFMEKKELWNKTKIMIYPKSLFCEYGTSRTNIEAMQLGIPVIADKGRGIDEIPVIKTTEKQGISEQLKKVLDDYDNYSKKAKKGIYEKYDALQEVEKVRNDIEKAKEKKGNILFFIGKDIGIGNIIQSLPAIKAVKGLGYDVDILLNPSYIESASILEEIPYISAVYTSDYYDIEKYDVILSNHEVFTPEKIKESGKEIHYSKLNKEVHESNWYMNLPRELGYKGKTPEIELFVNEKKYLGFESNSIGFAVDVWKTWKNNEKKYPYYKELIDHYNNQGNYTIVFGTEKNGNINPKKDFIGKTTISQVINAINQCDKFIGNDTGLCHISSALNIPTYTIFGSTSDLKNKPFRAKVVKLGLECQPCQFTDKFMKCETKECMNDLTPGKVISIINEKKLNVQNEIIAELPIEGSSKNGAENQLNILIRVSKRINRFNTCVKSIAEQNYGNFTVHIITELEDIGFITDILSRHGLIKKSYIKKIQPIKKESIPQPPKGLYKFPANLYLNELLNSVQSGWILFMDDDDYYCKPDAFNIINDSINNNQGKRLILWKVYLTHIRKSVPRDDLIGKKPVACQISGIGVCYHNSIKNVAKWDAYSLGDYRLITKLYDYCIKDGGVHYINNILTALQEQIGSYAV